MKYTIDNLRSLSSDEASSAMQRVAALFEKHYNKPDAPPLIDEGTVAAMHKKLERGEAIVMTVKDETGKIVGASFSVIPRTRDASPTAGVYTYEVAPEEAREFLLAESLHAIAVQTGNNGPVFYEGTPESRRADEQAGFRLIRFDNAEESPRFDAGRAQYQWCEGDYEWMVHGTVPPSQKQLEAAIHLQRAFVAESINPKDLNLDAALGEQILPAYRKATYRDEHGTEQDGYGVTESIAHARAMAVDGRMELEPLVGQRHARNDDRLTQR